MNRATVLLVGCLLTFSSSWLGLVVAPYFQLENLKPVAKADGASYPQPYQGTVAQGRRVYIANGCIYCHSQQVRPQGFGTDFERGWAGVDNPRRSVPLDYLYDKPHQLGTMRTGPDLVNIGSRQPSAVWHHTHLYNPRATSPGSVMPDFSFLYVKRRSSGEPSPDVQLVSLPPRPTEAGLVELLAAGDPVFGAEAGFVSRAAARDPSQSESVRQSVRDRYAALSPAERRRVARGVLNGLDPLGYLEPGYEVVPTDDAKALVDYLKFLDRTTPPTADAGESP